jgi:serine protease Do
VAKESLPRAVGVISTARRPIPKDVGYLGISWVANSYDGSGARLMTLLPKSNALAAGLREDDIVIAVNGTPTPDRQVFVDTLHTFTKGETVTLSVKRDDLALTIRAVLGDDPAPSDEEAEFTILSGPVNKRSGGFPAVLQHDTVILPTDCGGPLVDLDGNVIGINIARAGRTETYAIPSDLIIPLLDPMKTGKMPPPDDK